MHEPSSTTTPIVKDLVLIGGGHSHLAVLRRFGMEPMDGVRVTLVAREVHTPYSGMIPGYVAGLYDLDECHIDLRPLSRFARARLLHTSAVGLDLEARRVHLADGRPSLSFDLVSLDIGSTPDLSQIEGAREVGIPVKPISRFVEWLSARQGAPQRPPQGGPPQSGGWGAGTGEPTVTPRRLVVVGAGAGGVELVLNVQARLEREGAAAGIECHLVSGTDRILPEHNRRVQRIFARILDERGITVHTQGRVVRAGPQHLITERGHRIAYDEVIWATHAGAAPWLAETGLALDARGFVEVDAHLRSVSHPFIFAAGDVATIREHPRPRSGVFAVRQGPPLTDNLRCALRSEPTRPFRPQRSALSLIGTGHGDAVASRGVFAARGRWLWHVKDRIDRRFVRRFSERPAMQQSERAALRQLPLAGLPIDDEDELRELLATPMRCGGCGSKIAQDVLERALERARTQAPSCLTDAAPGRVLIGLDDPDDAAVLEIPPGMALVQSIDGFRSLVDDPWLLGRIGTNHALGDIWAMGAAPRTALALVTVPYGLESRVEDDLVQVLAGTLSVLGEAGAELVGGHTTEGPEMFFGLQVSGLVEPARLLRKRGLVPGQALVLTRAIGTGTLFAAEMRGLARGRWIEAAIARMVRTSGDAATCLAEHGASACTDVTGFGLLGHLVEMLRASGADAELDLPAVPVLDGALELVTGGIFSSLQPQNLRLRRAVRNHAAVASKPGYALLFDPQTAGGLLAGVDVARADACVDALRALGHADSAVIGYVTQRAGDDGPGVVIGRAV